MTTAYHRLTTAILLLGTASVLPAQRSRISHPIDPTRIVPLTGNLRPAVLRQNDEGRVQGDFRLPAMTLFLKPSPDQRADLHSLLENQQNPASSLYHRWLTPEEFADRFGLSPNDIASTVDWLRSQGFAVRKVAHSRTWIAFGGTAREVENVFHTEIHRYRLAGKSHFANVTELSIPAALADAVSGVEGLSDELDDFSPAAPEMTSLGGVHTLAPDDLATIYDITPLYQSGIDGTGQKIAVMGNSQFNSSALADVAAFRTQFHLPPNVPQVVLSTDYPDPGLTAGINEAHLDIEWAGAIARNAQIVFVYSGTFLHAVLYTVDNNLAPVITMSANVGCEALNTSANMTFYQGIAQQANAQGITWVNSGSDAGPASCDPNGAPLAVSGLGVRFPASIPEVTAVGGTEFNEQGGAYWSATNTNGASALSYIPEMVWNDALALGLLWAGGGGTSIYFSKPAWQAGPGVPNDNARDLPDVALAASFSHDGYYVVRNGASVTTGGTSASAPVFAGILALLNQYLVSNGTLSAPGLGNVNPALYRLAAAGTGAFHDITAGNNIVPCGKGTLDCPNGSMGFSAAPGYDLASGLGSVDAAKFLNLWSSQPPAASAVVVSANQNPVYQQPPDADGNRWIVKLTLTEEAGGGTTLTGFTINGVSNGLAAFSSASIPAGGSTAATVKFANMTVPAVVVFGFTGMDASGQTWSQKISIPFDGPSGPLTVAGVANAASYQQVFAPGMLMYVAGSQLSPLTQVASSVPFLTFMGDVSATINGFAAPLFYVSPSQLDIQIPYEVPPGPAVLIVISLGQASVFNFTIGPAAPGIFAAQDGSLVPTSSGARGDTLPLFITGQGAVSPPVATGAAPSAGTPTSQLPAPNLPVTVTVGGTLASPAFIGIPPGLVGVTQINFQIPQAAPLGTQPVVVTIGGVASAPVMLTVTH
jgi:uncharacterized protein (TIGR03437 family)